MNKLFNVTCDFCNRTMTIEEEVYLYDQFEVPVLGICPECNVKHLADNVAALENMFAEDEEGQECIDAWTNMIEKECKDDNHYYVDPFVNNKDPEFTEYVQEREPDYCENCGEPFCPWGSSSICDECISAMYIQDTDDGPYSEPDYGNDPYTQENDCDSSSADDEYNKAFKLGRGEEIGIPGNDYEADDDDYVDSWFNHK